MLFSEQIVEMNYLDNLSKAKQVLRDLDFVGSSNVSFKGLSDWVFGQTIRQCLKAEFLNSTLCYEFHEQYDLVERTVNILVVGKVAIGVKTIGLYNNELEMYDKVRFEANEKGLGYLYIALNETYDSFKESAKNTFGNDNAFFLNEIKSWMKFVSKLIELNSV